MVGDLGVITVLLFGTQARAPVHYVARGDFDGVGEGEERLFPVRLRGIRRCGYFNIIS